MHSESTGRLVQGQQAPHGFPYLWTQLELLARVLLLSSTELFQQNIVDFLTWWLSFKRASPSVQVLTRPLVESCFPCTFGQSRQQKQAQSQCAKRLHQGMNTITTKGEGSVEGLLAVRSNSLKETWYNFWNQIKATVAEHCECTTCQ